MSTARMKKSAAVVIREIRQQMQRIGKERDKLREMVDEANSIIGTCGDALDDFEHGLDTMSQYI